MPVTTARRRGTLRPTQEAAMFRLHGSIVAGALAVLIACAPSARAQSIVPELEQEIRQRAAQIEEKLIAWRRDIHEHPELGEQETRTTPPGDAHLPLPRP